MKSSESGIVFNSRSPLFYIKYTFRSFCFGMIIFRSLTVCHVTDLRAPYCPFGEISPMSDGPWFVSAGAAVVVSFTYPGP